MLHAFCDHKRLISRIRIVKDCWTKADEKGTLVMDERLGDAF